MRFSLKRLTLILVATVVVLILYLICIVNFDDMSAFYQDLLIHDRYDDRSFKNSDSIIRQEFHYSNYLFEGYDNFTALYDNDIERVQSLPLNEKCKAFFDQHELYNPEWAIDLWRGDIKFEKNINHKKMFFKSRSDILKEQKSAKGESDEITRIDNNTINEEFKNSYKASKIAEQGMADTITLMRLYGKCFVNNENHEMNDIYQKYSNKLFPFLNTHALPTFERLTQQGDRLFGDNILPVFHTDNQFTGQTVLYDPGHDNLIDFLHKNTSGKGIVISAANKHVRDLIKLIRVLRALNNRLPIQIVYNGDINTKSRRIIELVATRDIDFLLNPGMASEHLDVLPELKLLEQYKDYGSEFPPQDIWLVNIKFSIEKQEKQSFPKYSNKLLALLMSSFEEVVLLDADTVPLVPIIEFFESDEYKKSGTFFFKDRSLRDHNDYIETNYFSKLFPINEKSMDTLFNIPLVTNKTMSNKYMTGWRHFQEAGVVALQKKDHFLPILMTLPLSYWRDPARSSIWGDKEMYWLGFAMSGDESYEFNEYSAASVGELTKNSTYAFYPNTTSQELCSTHPGHVDKNGKLLWINSGFSFCKKNGSFRDRLNFPFSIFEAEELNQKYSKPLQIRAAIIPPDLPNLREPFNPIDDTPELDFMESWTHRHKDMDELDNRRIEDYGPQKGWMHNPNCQGYFYCAYNQIATYNLTNGNGLDEGHVFEFDEESTKLFDYLGKIWITGNVRTEPRARPVKPTPQSTVQITSIDTSKQAELSSTQHALIQDSPFTQQSQRMPDIPEVVQQEPAEDISSEEESSSLMNKLTNVLDKSKIPKEQQLSESGNEFLGMILADLVVSPARSQQYATEEQEW
ncbi:glycosyltransferase family 71 protein [Suhomyces tanzawaensis NRRL Y-17324]|uniref:Glycosyltransferase family 71 protein n=1 Tax=Suhomyces tanzawaensis NRRL Y-17324 TaxID=984487 RepID=A0A1E4SN31_9ASCO|nr:glycosyltransferase family 71 protein [Suhomyces tanzawaensis NRRL Y-17324]ODV80923.1 glycosyltransferase family 71 protein [Suhomyces tanzawaensis NRRL Y-17324]